MNPSDWMYHLNLRMALLPRDFLAPASQPVAGGRPRRVRARRLALAGAAVLAPALFLSAALLGG